MDMFHSVAEIYFETQGLTVHLNSDISVSIIKKDRAVL